MFNYIFFKKIYFAFCYTGNNSRVIFTIFENTKIFQVRQMNRRYELNGKVASATLISNGKSVLDLEGNFVRSVYKPLNVRITLIHTVFY